MKWLWLLLTTGAGASPFTTLFKRISRSKFVVDDPKIVSFLKSFTGCNGVPVQGIPMASSFPCHCRRGPMGKDGAAASISFVIGGLCSAAARYAGMVVHEINGRTVSQPLRCEQRTHRLPGGSVMMSVVGIGVLGIVVCYVVFTTRTS